MGRTSGGVWENHRTRLVPSPRPPLPIFSSPVPTTATRMVGIPFAYCFIPDLRWSVPRPQERTCKPPNPYLRRARASGSLHARVAVPPSRSPLSDLPSARGLGIERSLPLLRVCLAMTSQLPQRSVPIGRFISVTTLLLPDTSSDIQVSYYIDRAAKPWELLDMADLRVKRVDLTSIIAVRWRSSSNDEPCYLDHHSNMLEPDPCSRTRVV